MPLTQVQGQMLNGSNNTTTTIQSNGTTAITIDSSQNVGVGTTNPSYKFHVANGYGFFSGANYGVLLGESNCLIVGDSGTTNAANMIFYTANTERMRITSGGDLLVGTGTATGKLTVSGGGNTIYASQATASSYTTIFNSLNQSGTYYLTAWQAAGSTVGSVTSNGTTTSYGTTSDYRLKENIAPMQNALGVVSQLKPVTYNWKVDGSAGQGFIAHELQAVVPDAVTGEKDAVDEEGNIKPQGIDTSFLVATLTAAIQELKAELDATKAEVAELKAKGQ